MGEHFTRNVQFFGRDSQEKIMQSFVIVIGLGVSTSGYIIYVKIQQVSVACSPVLDARMMLG